MSRRALLIVVVAAAVAAGVLSWLAAGRPLRPTLPEIGPGARRGVDAGGVDAAR